MSYQRLPWRDLPSPSEAAHGGEIEEGAIHHPVLVGEAAWDSSLGRRFGPPALAATLLAVAVIAARGSSNSAGAQPLQRIDTDSVQVALEVKTPQCGLREHDVDYEGQALASAHVQSSSDCRSWCEEDDSCSAWSFGGFMSGADVCILKGTLDASAPIIRRRRPGVVSGVPCRGRFAADAKAGIEEHAWTANTDETSSDVQDSKRYVIVDGGPTSATSDGSQKQAWNQYGARLGSTYTSVTATTTTPIHSVAQAPVGLSDTFDCIAGYNNWQRGWSESKKSWCCRHRRLGCLAESTTSEPFDCSAGLVNWQAGWSSQKKAHCCKRWKVGCSGAEASAPLSRTPAPSTWAPPATSPAPATTAAPKPSTITETDTTTETATTSGTTSTTRSTSATEAPSTSTITKITITTSVTEATSITTTSTTVLATSSSAKADAVAAKVGASAHKCPPLEEDVDYKSDQQVAQLEHVSSPGACRDACDKQPNCDAWAWGDIRDVPGITDYCWLKSLDTPYPKKMPRLGVISGLSCKDGKEAHSLPQPLVSVENLTKNKSESRTVTEVTTTTAVQATSLFCWCLCMPKGYEPNLLRLQRKHNASLFACEEYAVYSSSVFEVAPGVTTLKVDSDLKAVYGGEFYTALNTWIFLKVWDKVIDDGTYANYGWTVKVDPDAVFFPSRLRASLVAHGELENPSGVYINNCKYGLHGPIEVFSANAVKAFARDRFKCVQHIDTDCDGGPCEWGEDLFLDECLHKVLNVTRDDIMDLMIETACDPPGGEVDCKTGKAAVYHPFKSTDEWSSCYNEAK